MVIDVSAYVAEEFEEYQMLLDEAVQSGNELEQILLFRDLYSEHSAKEPRDVWREIAYLESAMWVFEHTQSLHLPIGTYYRTARELAFTYLGMVMDRTAAVDVFERALRFSEQPEVQGKGRLELEWLRRGHAWLKADMEKG
jgi:hypothetical protein